MRDQCELERYDGRIIIRSRRAGLVSKLKWICTSGLLLFVPRDVDEKLSPVLG